MKVFLGYCFLYYNHSQIWSGVLSKDIYEMLKKLIDNEHFTLISAGTWTTAEEWDDTNEPTDLKLREKIKQT